MQDVGQLCMRLVTGGFQRSPGSCETQNRCPPSSVFALALFAKQLSSFLANHIVLWASECSTWLYWPYFRISGRGASKECDSCTVLHIAKKDFLVRWLAALRRLRQTRWTSHAIGSD